LAFNISSVVLSIKTFLVLIVLQRVESDTP
jgi:hypothetical protein